MDGPALFYTRIKIARGLSVQAARARIFIIFKEDVIMRQNSSPVRQDYEKRFPRTFVIGKAVHTTENGLFVMDRNEPRYFAPIGFTYRGGAD